MNKQKYPVLRLHSPRTRLKIPKGVFRPLGTKISNALNYTKRTTEPTLTPCFIDTLPAELLSYIFLLLEFTGNPWPAPSGTGISWPQRTRLMLVCKKWKMTVLATKQLWTAVNMTWPHLVPLLLERSGEALLRVTITDYAEFAQINQLISTSSHRISSLHMISTSPTRRTSPGFFEVIELLCDPKISWPFLKELEIGLDPSPRHYPLDTFTLHGPVQLTQLTIDGGTCPRPTSSIFGPWLHNLSLKSMKIPSTTLRAIILQCTQLRKLDLDLLHLTGTVAERQQLVEVPLHCLRHLYLGRLPSQDTRLFLEHPKIPTEAFASLVFYDIERLLPLNYCAFTRFHQNQVLIFDWKDMSSVLVEGHRKFDEKIHYFPFATDVHQEVDSISIPGGVEIGCIPTLLSAFGSPNCLVLGLNLLPHLDLKTITVEQWRRMFNRFPNIEHLYIKDIYSGRVSQILILVQALTSSCDGQDVEFVATRYSSNWHICKLPVRHHKVDASPTLCT